MTEYKQRGNQKNGGILTRTLKPDDGFGRLSECVSRYSLSSEVELKQVCYLQLQIDMDAVCNAEKKATEAMASPTARWSYGEFDPEDVIEGWVEVFDLLDSDSKGFTMLDMDSMEVSDGAKPGANMKPDNELIKLVEVVIPPELAYGKKGMIGKVGPNETLWFLMAVK